MLALGKLGSQEMTASSDLDLIFMYRTDEEPIHSDGNKPLSKTQYFARLSQRLINALTTLTSALYLAKYPGWTTAPVLVCINKW